MIEHNNDIKEFQASGLLWFVNSIIQLFGWCLFVSVDKDTGEITEFFPERTKYRGFPEQSNTNGYIKLSKYMKENADKLLQDAES